MPEYRQPESRQTTPAEQTLVQKGSDGRKRTATARCVDERINAWDLEVLHPSGDRWERREMGNENEIAMKLAVMMARYEGQFLQDRASGDRPREPMLRDTSRTIVDVPVRQSPHNITYKR